MAKKKSTTKDYKSVTNDIIAAAKGGASKQEIREMVIAHNASLAGTKNQAKAKINVRSMWSYMPKPKNKESKSEARETVTLPTSVDADGNASSSTIQVEKQPHHDTDALYKNYAHADDLVKPGPPKRAVFKMKGWSGYQNKK